MKRMFNTFRVRNEETGRFEYRKIVRAISFILVLFMVITSLPADLVGTNYAFASKGTDLTTGAVGTEDKTDDIRWTIGSGADGTISYTLSSDTSTQKELKKAEDGSYDLTGVSINNLNSVHVAISFSLSDERALEEDDYILFQAPTGLRFDAIPGDINTAEGDSLAKFTKVDEQTLKMSFTSIVEDSSYLGLGGTFTIDWLVDEDQVASLDRDENGMTAILDNIVGQIKVAFPEISNKISGLEKSGVANENLMGADWTITVGSDSTDVGVALSGVTVTDTFETADMAAYGDVTVTDASGTSFEAVPEFTEKEDGTTSFQYTFTEGVAPATITYTTQYSESFLEEAAKDKKSHASDSDYAGYTVSNMAAMSSEDADKVDPKSVTAEVAANVTSVEKAGEQIDANTMQWTLILNEVQNNVYAADVVDQLTEGLTVDENYGIRIEDVTSNTTLDTLTASSDVAVNDSDSAKISYAIEKRSSDGGQNLTISFANTFQHEYKIVFRTKVAANYTNAAEDSDSVAGAENTINNTAYVTVQYPTGSGNGGPGIVYQDTEVRTVFVSAFLDVTAEGVDEETGKLTWCAIPSSKTDYKTAKVSIQYADYKMASDTSAAEQTRYDSAEPVVKYVVDGEEKVLQTGYELTDSETGFQVVFNQEALGDIDLSQIRIYYNTKATTYFTSDENLTYKQHGDIVITTDEDVNYTADSKVAKQSLQNKLLTKSVKTVFDDENNDAYFAFTIKMNQKQLALTEATLQDDLSTCLTLEDGTTVPADWFELMDAGTGAYHTYVLVGNDTADTTENRKISGLTVDTEKKIVTYSQNLSDVVTLQIYMRLTDAGKAALGAESTATDGDVKTLVADNQAVVIGANNTATLTAKGPADETVQIAKTAISEKETQKLTSQNVSKTSSQEDGSAEIDWTIKVNPAFAKEASTQTIVDTIPTGLSLDRKSIKVYVGKHSADGGSAITAGEELDSSNYTVTVKSNRATKTSGTTTTLTVKLKDVDAEESYMISYATIIQKSGAYATYTNALNYEVGTATIATSHTHSAKAFSSGTGYRVVMFSFTKLDRMSTADDPIPVEGAHYGLYTEPDCTEESLVADGYTDAEGKLTLMGKLLDSNGDAEIYYIKEMDIEAGEVIGASSVDISQYNLDTKVYGPYSAANKKGGNYTIAPVLYDADSKTGKADGSTYFTDVRKADVTGTAKVNKIYTYEADGQTELSGLTSDFTLTVFPKAESENNTTYQKTVMVTGADGSYQYVGVEGATTEEGAESTLTTTASTQEASKDGESTLEISNLPWGTYELTEKKAPDGFLLSDTKIRFQVGTDGTVTYLDSDGTYTATGNDTIVNQQTEFTLKKTGSDGTTLLSDYQKASFTITSKSVDSVGNPVFSETYRGENVSNQDGIYAHLIGVLKTGETYTITEIADGIPYGYARVKSFTATISTSGKVTVSAAAPATVVDNTVVTVKEPLTNLQIQKMDQKGDVVESATLHIEDVTESAEILGFAVLSADGIPTGEVVRNISDWESTSEKWNLTGQLLAGHTYRVTEVSTPDGYRDVTDASTYYIDLAVDSYGTISVTNSTLSDKAQVAFKGTLNNAKNVLTIQNQKILADVKIVKVSALDQETPIEGATFQILDGDTVVQTGTTGANGVLDFTDVPKGEYTVVESALADDTTAKNYIRDTKTYSLSITDEAISPYEADANTNSGKSILRISNTGDEEKQVFVNEAVATAIQVENPVPSTYNIYEENPEETNDLTPINEAPIQNGETFEKLEWQKTYYIKQVSVADGYILDDTVHTISAFAVPVKDIPSKEKMVTETFENAKTAVSIYKVDQKNAPVAGAEFTLEAVGDSKLVTDDLPGNVTWTEDGKLSWTTEVDGESSVGVSLEGVFAAGGTYQITETKTGEEYLSAVGDSVEITVDTAGVVTVKDLDTEDTLGVSVQDNQVTLTNHKIYAAVKLTKVDESKTSKKLAGAKFELYQKTGETADKAVDSLMGTYTTDENGEILVENLPYGTYYFEEIEAPSSYVFLTEENHYEFTIDAKADGTTKELTVKNRRIAGSITITKTGEGSTVDGAEYTLYQYNEKTEAYEAVQVDGQDYTLSIAGATQVDGGYRGSVTFTDLDWGTYYVKETKAPKGYQLDATMHGAYIIKDGALSVEASVSDDVTSLNFELLGVLSEQDGEEVTEKLEGIDVTISGPMNAKDADGNWVTEKTFTTDEDGQIHAKNLFITGNEYTVEAVDPADHYNVVESYRFCVLEDGSVALVENTYNSTKVSAKSATIQMKARKTLFFLELTDTQSHGLADGTLAIYEMVAGEVAETPVEGAVYTTEVDDEGDAIAVKVEGLLPGEYVLKQTETPEGYVPAGAIEFTLHADNTVTLKKSDGTDGETLGKAESVDPDKVATLVMEDYKTQLNVQTFVTPYESISKDADKEETLNGVEMKIYKDRNLTDELKLTDGSTIYLPKTSYEVTKENTDQTVTLISEEIEEQDDAALKYVLDGDGSTWIQGLSINQTYYLQVSGITDGDHVLLDTKVYVVHVGEDPTQISWAELTVDGSEMEYETAEALTIVNDVYRGDITLTKTDKEDHAKTLSDSTYGIYKASAESEESTLSEDIPESEEDWELLAEATTDEEGQITFDGLVTDVEYQIRELDEPDGYQVSKDPITVRLDLVEEEDGTVVGTKFVVLSSGNGTADIAEDGTITWYEPRAKVSVQKLSEDGVALSGATLEIVDKESGEVMDTWVTDGEAHLISGLMTAGKTYILRETKAPAGYVIAEDQIFEVKAVALASDEDYIQQITMIDYKSKEAEVKAREDAVATVSGYREELPEEGHSEENQSAGTSQKTISPHTGEIDIKLSIPYTFN